MGLSQGTASIFFGDIADIGHLLLPSPLRSFKFSERGFPFAWLWRQNVRLSNILTPSFFSHMPA